MDDLYTMSKADNIMYAKRCIVDSIYKQSRLEGIAVTFPETQEIYEGRSVSGLSVEDIIKVNNLKHGWQFIFDTIDYPLDLRYIRQHRKVFYTNLLTSGRLNGYLADIDRQATELFFRLIEQMTERESVTEKLKAEKPMKWAGKINTLREATVKIVNAEAIFA